MKHFNIQHQETKDQPYKARTSTSIQMKERSSSIFSNQANLVFFNQPKSSFMDDDDNDVGCTKRNHVYQKCLKWLSHSLMIMKAFIMRLIFSLHSFLAIVYVYLVKQDEWYLVNIVGAVFLLIEAFVTIIKRHGKEPKWFFPCFFIYICTMIPPIWFVELTRIDIANEKRKRMLYDNSTSSNGIEIDNIFGISQTLGLNQSILNDSFQLDLNSTAVYLEISVMFIIIMARWCLPKGNISRSALSQLLLVYMSLASDEYDLLTLLNETNVQESLLMSYFTLSIFSWSLFQFSLNLIVSRGRSFQSVVNDEQCDNFEEYEETNCQPASSLENSKSFIEKLNSFITITTTGGTSKIKLNRINLKSMNNINKTKLPSWLPKGCLKFDTIDNEIWSILITLIFQDGPFLALRLTAVINFNVRTFITMFFTCKNIIVLLLQFYRLSAIYIEANNDQNDATLDTNKADALASLNSAATHLDKFVLLSYTQKLLMKMMTRNKTASINNNTNNGDKLKSKASIASNLFASNTNITMDEGDKKLSSLNPIILRSTLSRNHSYAIVLTPNHNLTATCCQCKCHLKDNIV